MTGAWWGIVDEVDDLQACDVRQRLGDVVQGGAPGCDACLLVVRVEEQELVAGHLGNSDGPVAEGVAEDPEGEAGCVVLCIRRVGGERVQFDAEQLARQVEHVVG